MERVPAVGRIGRGAANYWPGAPMDDLTDYELETGLLRAQAEYYAALSKLLTMQANLRDRAARKVRLIEEAGEAAGK